MTEREMLELAAKAAGYEVTWSEKYDCAEIWTEGDKNKTFFNPLFDDGDSFRLRAKMMAMVADEGDCVYVCMMQYPFPAVEIRVPYERDLSGGYSSLVAVCKSTRIAIVKAAAQIQQLKEAQ